MLQFLHVLVYSTYFCLNAPISLYIFCNVVKRNDHILELRYISVVIIIIFIIIIIISVIIIIIISIKLADNGGAMRYGVRICTSQRQNYERQEQDVTKEYQDLL